MSLYLTYKTAINLCIFLIGLAAIVSSCRISSNDILTIAIAANAKFAIEEIANEFTHETGIKTQIIIASSGKHTAQIDAGAPYDVFISADIKFPQLLYEKGLTLTPPKIYAFGTLVIWTLQDSLLLDFNNLLSDEVRSIALPNPKTAPYGLAAYEALNYLDIYDSISHKLIYGENVAQTNQFIISKSVEIGFSAASITMAPAMKNIGRWQVVDRNAYSPMAQAAVVISQSKHALDAEKFYLFLFSPKAQNILQAYGYKTLDIE